VLDIFDMGEFVDLKGHTVIERFLQMNNPANALIDLL